MSTERGRERDERDLRDDVRRAYGEIASDRGPAPACGVEAHGEALGYSREELDAAPEGANLGLGCGNPTALAELRPGDVVVDLGSGAGFDAFLAAERVGPDGRVIGVDMTDEMLERARANAKATGRENVEFRKGFIEDLPVEDGSVDAILSNCVINLSPDKPRVFAEAHRALRAGGRLFISDVVLTRRLPEAIASRVDAYVGCVAGAMLRDDYLAAVRDAGFEDVRVLGETSFGPLLQSQFPELAAAAAKDAGLSEAEVADAAEGVVSLKFTARKPAAG